MCNIKYLICDPVSFTKKIATFSSKNKTKYLYFSIEHFRKHYDMIVTKT